MVGMRLYTVRVRIVIINTGVKLETIGSNVAGYLGDEPHVISILGNRKGAGRKNKVQLLHVSTGICADAGLSQFVR